MLDKIIQRLSGMTCTLIAGGFLLLELLPSVAAWFGISLPEALGLPIAPAWGTVLLSGTPLILLAVKRMLFCHGLSKISSALLISIAMFAAIGIGDLFAAGEVAFIMAIGALLEDHTVERAKKGLHRLIALAPTQARRLRSGVETLISADDVQVGDVVRVLPGEVIPVDGTILSGETSINQAVLTGESLPVEKSEGDAVFCGTLNAFGAIDIHVTRVCAESSLQKLIRMVAEAEGKRAPMQRIADRWASLLVPIALLIAILAGCVTQELTVAVTILVVFCPCALVLATPTAIMAAIGQATRRGVMIKSGSALEMMGSVDTIAFDKTGTLTFGKPEVCAIETFSALPETEVLRLTAIAERKSEHSLGKTIVEYAQKRNLSLTDPDAFTMTVGRGIRANVEGHTLLCGSEAYLRAEKVTLPEAAEQRLNAIRSEGKAVMLSVIDGCCAGLFAFHDALRAETTETLTHLKALGMHTILLTGDHATTANSFAKQTPIETVHAELLPETKVTVVSDLQKRGATVCMVGDGINDAPALKQAHVGVAMGINGTDITVDAADIVLMRDDLSLLPYLKRLATATTATIRFGITLSLVINAIAILLSLFGLLTPTTGALVHNAGSCLVVLIAAHLYDRTF